MFEVYVLVDKEKSLVMKLLTILCFVIGAYFLYVSLRGLLFFFAVAVPFIAIGWFLMRRNIEYEYSYFDGAFRFAKVISKQKRKELIEYDAENVIVIAPKDDRSVYQYKNKPNVKLSDLTSGKKDAKVYAMVSKVDKGFHMTLFEPDEKYLDAVCIKYRQKVVR